MYSKKYQNLALKILFPYYQLHYPITSKFSFVSHQNVPFDEYLIELNFLLSSESYSSYNLFRHQFYPLQLQWPKPDSKRTSPEREVSGANLTWSWLWNRILWHLYTLLKLKFSDYWFYSLYKHFLTFKSHFRHLGDVTSYDKSITAFFQFEILGCLKMI